MPARPPQKPLSTRLRGRGLGYGRDHRHTPDREGPHSPIAEARWAPPSPAPRERGKRLARGFGMAFAPGFLDELRGRVSLAGLVGRRVKLTRRGREFAGLCPFHHEKTPSFYVVEDKNFFHCFGCGAHGDAIGFVMRADNLDFLEAVEKLAGEAGLAVPQATPEERERAQRQKTLLETLDAAAGFYEAKLWAPAGAARATISRRAVSTPRRSAAFAWAGRRMTDRRCGARSPSDYPEPLLVEAGLLHRPKDGEPFDYFRGRVMFPIGDRAGRVIAFGGRVMGRRPAQIPEFARKPAVRKRAACSTAGRRRARRRRARRRDRHRRLYGRDRATSRRVHDRGRAARHGADRIPAAGAVAPGGPSRSCALTVTLPDKRAAFRALHRALPLLRPGHSLRFAALPPGEDPDSLIRRAGRARVRTSQGSGPTAGGYALGNRGARIAARHAGTARRDSNAITGTRPDNLGRDGSTRVRDAVPKAMRSLANQTQKRAFVAEHGGSRGAAAATASAGARAARNSVPRPAQLSGTHRRGRRRVRRPRHPRGGA